jgi:hypothetical protein
LNQSIGTGESVEKAARGSVMSISSPREGSRALRRTFLTAITLAALVMTAAASAPRAEGSEFTSDRYPFTVKGVDAEIYGAQSFHWAGGTFSCEPPSLATESAPGAENSLTASETASGKCHMFGEGPLQMNGCTITFKLDHGLSVSCPSGKSITTKLYFGLCDLNLKFKEGAASYSDAGEGDVLAEGYLRFTAVPTSGSCPIGESTAEYYPTWRLSGYDTEEDPTDFSVAFGRTPVFEAEEYPLALAGEQTLTFSESGRSPIECDGALEADLSGASKDLTLEAAYDQCNILGLPTVARPNGCKFDLHLRNPGPPYSAYFDIGCDEEGEAFEYLIYVDQEHLEKKEVHCIVEIGPQDGLEGVGLSTTGSADDRGIVIDAEITGISWEVSGACPSEAHDEGVLSGEVTVEGVEGPFNFYVAGEETEAGEAEQPHLAAAEYPATVGGVGSLNFINPQGGGYVDCDGVSLEGDLPGPSPRPILEAQYDQCVTITADKSSLPTVVDMNTCSYAPSIYKSGARYKATLDIECGEGDEIEYHLYADQKALESEEAVCTIMLPPQQEFLDASLADTEAPAHDVVLDIEVEGLNWYTVGGCGGAPKVSDEGILLGSVTLAGEDESEEPVDLHLTHAPRIDAETYPLALAGDGPLTFVDTHGGGSIECDGVELGGQLWGATSSLPLDADYGDCTTGAENATFPTAVDTNSCRYVVNVENSGPSYGATLGVTCDVNDDAIEYLVYASQKALEGNEVACRVRLPEQAGLGGVDLTNVGAAPETQIRIDVDVEGVEWERELCSPVARADGALSGEFVLEVPDPPLGVFLGIPPPDTLITSGPEGTVNVTNPEATFSFEAAEAGFFTYECNFSGSYVPCSSPKTLQDLAEKGHTFKVRAVTESGSRDPTPAQRTFSIVDYPGTTITSPTPTYTSHELNPISFTSEEIGTTFKCSLDDPSEKPTTPCTSSFALPPELGSGWHTFVVAATDVDGHTDATPAKYTFNTGIYPDAPAASKLVSPEEGYTSSSHYTLRAKWGNLAESGSISGLTFQMKLYHWKAFKTVPVEFVTDAKGKQVSWPLSVPPGPGESSPVFFDAEAYRMQNKMSEGMLDEDTKFRAVFDGSSSAAGASQPVKVEYDRKWEGSRTNATETVGPANLDLLTGLFTINRTDVSIPIPGYEANLEFGRTYESGGLSTGINGKSFLLGYLWQPSMPVEQAYEGHGWTKILVRHENAIPAQYEEECWEGECENWMVEDEIPAADWAELLDNEGAGIPLTWPAATTSPQSTPKNSS